MTWRESNGVFATLLLCLTPSGAAHASCVRFACFEMAGRVAACEQLRHDGRDYLRLSIPQPRARETSCGATPLIEAPPGGVADAIDRLQDERTFFVAAQDTSCADLVDRQFAGGVAPICCDTVPASGECTLDGLLLIPTPPPLP